MKRLLIFAFSVITPLIMFAQVQLTETNCSNGIDDDGDGLIDCVDPDCMGSPDCASLNDGPVLNGVIEGTGTFFEVVNSDYLNITLSSSADVTVFLSSVPQMISMNISRPASTPVPYEATLTISGLLPLTVYFKYDDSYHNLDSITTDINGNYTWTQILNDAHHVWIQPTRSTIFICDDATGCGCATVGVWDTITKTCTLNKDVTETIQIDSPYITLDGNNHSITGSGTGYGIYVSEKDSVTIKNCSISNFSEGIRLETCSNNTITNNNISSNGIGLFLYTSPNNALTYNTISSNSGGITLYSGSDSITLDNNNVSNNSGNGIYLSSSSNNNFTNNTFNSNNYGISGYASSYNNLTGNTVSLNNSYGIHFNQSSNNTVINNVANSNSNGIYLQAGAGGNTLTDNTTNSNSIGIYISNCSYNNISGNFATGNSYSGFIIPASSNNTIINNNVSNNNGFGVVISSGSNNIITDNIVSNNLNAGIQLSGGSNNSISGNTTSSNNTYGIRLDNVTNSNILNNISELNSMGLCLNYNSGNNFLGNQISGNVEYGIFLQTCQNSIIGGTSPQQPNTITNNGISGIYLTASNGIKISGNSIYNNPIAVQNVDGSNNNKAAPVITSFDGLNLTGTSDPNDIIEIFGGSGNENANEYISSVQADGTGNWQCVVSTNYNYLLCNARDANNNTSPFRAVKSVTLPVCTYTQLSISINNLTVGSNVNVTIHMPSGIVALDSATLNGYTTQVIADTTDINNPIYSFTAPATSVTLYYYIKAGCGIFETSTHLYTNSITIENDGNYFSLVDSFYVQSPVLVFDSLSSNNMVYNNAFINISFYRTFVYKNTGSAFTGDFLFRDTTYETYNNTAINIIGIECLSQTATVIDKESSDTTAYIKLRINNLLNDSVIIIREEVKLVNCPYLYNNISHFNVNYGCSNDSLCAQAYYLSNNTVTREDPNDRPEIKCELLTRGYPNCWSDLKERILKVTNTGQGIADTVVILIYKNGYIYVGTTNHISENITDSVRFYKYDGINYTEITNYSVLELPLYCQYIIPQSLAHGDSLFIRYYEVVHCIDSLDYYQYFNHDINMHHEAFPLVKLLHKCNPTGYATDGPMSIWHTWEHTSRLVQVFNNYVGTLNGGDESWFNVTGSTLLLVATPCAYTGNQMGFIFHVDSSAIEVKLKLDPGLGLVTDSIYISSLINGTPVKIYPFDISYNLGSPAVIGNGNTISAYFAIPDSFYYAAASNLDGFVDIPTPYYQEFFNNFKVRFKLHAYCEYMQLEPSKIVQEFFFLPNRFCNPDCKLPLSSVNDKVRIHCPGCVLPGWNLSEFTIKRKNFGFTDNDNNNFPDNYNTPMQMADTLLAQIHNAIIGDTIELNITGNTSDGGYIVKSNGDSVFIGFNNIGFNYRYGQMLYLFPMFDKLRFIKAEGTLSDGIGTYPFSLPPSMGCVYPGAFTIYLDLDTLHNFGLPSSFNRFWANNTMTLKSTFVVTQNLVDTSAQNPYYSIQGIDARMNMSGTPYPPGIEIKTDAGTLAELHPDSFLSLDTTELALLNYWCTGWDGHFGAIGVDYNFYNGPTIGNVDSYFANFNPCLNIIRFHAYTEVGHHVFGGYSDQYGEQMPWNAFSYEIRNLWMLDSIKINYPSDYILDSVIFVTTQLTSDGGITHYTCNPWAQGAYSWHVYDMSDADITSTYATIYPARNFHHYTSFPGCIGPSDSLLTAWDETKRYRIFFVLKSNTCAPPEIIPSQGYDVVSWWSNFPGTQNGDTAITKQITSGNFTRPGTILNSIVNMPITQDAQNSDIQFDMNISADCISNNCDIWESYVNNGIAVNTFVVIHSPSGTFSVDSIINSHTGQTIPVVNSVSGDSVYGLGFVGNTYAPYVQPSDITVFSSYDCANITGKDSVLIYTGWNCEGYPDDLNNICYLDSQWLSLNVIKPGLNVSLNAPGIFNFCDTLHYSLSLSPTLIGNVHDVNTYIPMATGISYSYLPGTALLSYDGISTLVTYTGVDTLVFDLSGTGLLDNFNHGTALFTFDILPACDFYTSLEEVGVLVTAFNYCGNSIITPSLYDRPDIFTGYPEQDSLSVAITTPGSLSGCGDTTLITVSVTNLIQQSTGAYDTLFITLPLSFIWAGGDMYSTQNGQIYSFPISSGITFNNSQLFQFDISGSAAAGTYPLYASVMAAQVVPCAFDTCVFPATTPVSADTAEVIVIPLQASITTTDASCGGVCNGTATVTCSGIAPFTYYWSTGGISITENNICAGNHYVIVSDAKGCRDTLYFTINTAGSGLVVSASSNSPVCEGSQLELYAEGGTQYEWSGPAGFTSIEQNPVIFGITPANDGTYYVTVSDAVGCTETDSIFVIINILPVAYAGPDTVVCAGHEITLTATGGIICEWDNGVIQGVPFTPSATTTYTVTVTDAYGCADTDEVTINVNDLPTPFITGSLGYCPASSALLDVGVGYTSYQWSTGSTNQTINATITNNPINVTVTDANGCTGASSILNVYEYPLPSPMITGSPGFVYCAGSGTSLSVGFGSFATYLWSTGASTPTVNATITDNPISVTVTDNNGCTGISSAIDVIENPLPSPVISGSSGYCSGTSAFLSTSPVYFSFIWSTGSTTNTTYATVSDNPVNVTVTDINGCTGFSASVYVTENVLPSVSAGADISVCANTQITLSGTGATYYIWDNGVLDGVPFTPPAGVTTYTVTGTDDNGCTASDEVIVTVNSLPVVSAGADITECAGNQITLSGLGATSYIWDNGVINGVPFTPPAGITTYTVTGTDDNNCTASDEIIVTVNPLPVVSAGADITECAGTQITLSGTGATTYVWDNGVINGVTFTPPVGITTYTVTGTDNNGCTASDEIIVTVSPLPVITTSSNSPVCEGSQLELFAEGGTQYEWSGPAGFTSIEQNPVIANVTNAYAGTYYVTVTDAYGCTGTAETIVQIVSTNIIANFIIDPANIIQGSPVFFTFDGINTDSVTWEIDGIVTYGFTTNHTFYDYGYYCLTLTAGNICAQVDTTMNIYVFPSTCTLPQDFDILDGYEINGGVYWDINSFPGNILVEGDVIIKPYSVLFIEDKTVNFSPKGRIIVERNAGLIIENSTLTSLPGDSCSMWQGIEVWGSSGSSPAPGRVIITGNSTISNAHIGVLLGRRLLPGCGNTQQYPFSYGNNGGIIYASGATFNRNGIHIRFIRRNDSSPPWSLLNYISNNNFYCQGNLIDNKYFISNILAYPNPQNPWAGHANANTRTDVGIMFTKMKFILSMNMTGNHFDNSEYGIFGVDNQVIWYSNNNFSNHRKGIMGVSILPNVLYGYQIITNTFDYIPGNTINPDNTANDGTALYILGGVSDAVYEWNQFLNTSLQQSTGIIADNSNNFGISNNRFNRLATGTKIINSESNGGFVRAAPSTDPNNNWRGNQFQQCDTGVVTENNNQNLCIRCNDYFSEDPQALNWSSTGTLADQGFTFSPLIPCTNRKKSGSGNWFALSNHRIISATSYTFYHHMNFETRPDPQGGVISLSNVQCAITTDKSLHCTFPGLTPPINIGIIHTDPAVMRLDSFSDAITALEIQYDNLLGILDNGNTIQLLNAIYTNPPSGQLKNLLLNNSPLSDTVLIALNVTNPLALGNYKNVMEENLPVSRKVLPSFLARVETLPPGIKNQLKEKQAYNPGKITTGYLEAMIGQTTLLKKYYFHELLNILLDTANIRKEDAIALYEREGSAESKMIVAATYLSDGDYVTAASKIASLPETTQEISEWKAYANILLPHLSQGKEIEELDSVQIDAIRTIAWLCPAGIASANARALLLYLNREEVPPCPETGTRNKLIESNKTNTPISYLGDNYPDPFSGNTVIPYYLPENSKGEIVIMDALGREIKRYILQEGENKLNIDSRSGSTEWQSGIYFYYLVIDGRAVEYRKMIKAE